MLNLASLLENSVRDYPDKVAIILNETQLTYTQANAAANQIANGLVAAGIEPGDTVALSCPNVPYFPLVYNGILKTGATVVPLNVLLKGREIAYHLNDAGAKAYFCFEGTVQLPMSDYGQAGFADAAACEQLIVITSEPAAPSPLADVQTLGAFMAGQPTTFDTVQTNTDDTAVILYTSGTTGQPKGAELTHSNMVMNAMVTANLFAMSDADTSLITLPLFHSYGQTAQMNASLYSGGTMTLLPRFDPAAVLAIMQRDSVTCFAGVPTMYWAILNLPGAENDYDLPQIASNMRLASTGGSSMPVEVMKDFEEKFNVAILEGYGLSETSPICTFHHLGRPRKPGSVGEPIWGVELRVVDTDDHDVPVGELGEIVVRGHNVMKGYLGRPAATAEAMRNGWFHTGDIGKLDEDGYVYISDRVKDMVLRGGYNVYPREIEEVLMTHPAVSLAAVIGVPHDALGEEIKAFVILKEGAKTTPDALIAWSKENMAGYKYPRMLEIRDAFPMTASGKILKRGLRE